MLIYSFTLTGKKSNNTIEWDLDKESLDKLTLGIPMHIPLESYSKRNRLYSGFSIGYDDSLFFIEGSIELTKASLKESVFEIEIAVVPSKLEPERRAILEDILRTYKEDARFKVGWDDSLTGIKKRTDKAMKRVIKQLKDISAYGGEDDLKLEDIKVSVPEALNFLGFDAKAKKKDVSKSYMTSYRELTRKYHPDSDSGNEESFMFLQKCKSVLDGWIKK